MSEPTIESASQFKDTPEGQQQRWTVEIAAALENQKQWWEAAELAVKKYLGDGVAMPLYHANVNTVVAMLFGQLPSVDCSRRFDDAKDDDARLGAEELERVLQADIERDDDGFRAALRYNIHDWKTAGLGQAWLRYEVEWEDVPEVPAITRPDRMTGEMVELAPAVPATKRKSHEDVETDYIFWKDFLWSPTRNWHEIEWVAKRIEMTKDQLVERFGEEKAKNVPLHKKDVTGSETVSEEIKDAWSRAELYEIWCKQSKTQYFWAKGMAEILESKPDPLGLEDFFPCPRPLIANWSTSKFIPKTDYAISAHLYEEIDSLARRIRNLIDCAKVRWVYDKTNTGLKRLFEEANEGEGIPVDNWMDLVSKGGLAGAISFAPLAEIGQTIQVLTEKMQDKIQYLYQSTGLSDILRGSSNASETLGAQKLKAGFASTRIQTEQDEVARYATEIQKIRAEIVCRHFDPQTIVQRSNIMMTADGQADPARPMRAAAVLKDAVGKYRIEVKADSLALRDYASMKAERTETVTTLTGLFAQVLPMVPAFPPLGPFMLAVGEWLIAATKGSQQLESDFDAFRAQAEQAAKAAMAPKPPPPADPRVVAEQQKAQASVETAKIGTQKAGIDLMKAKVDLVGDIAKAMAPKPPPMAPGDPGGIA